MSDLIVSPSHSFDHHRLDAFRVGLEALVQGDRIARSLQGAYLQTAEAAARTGADRASRFRCARAEACEAAACLEAIVGLDLAPSEACEPVMHLLWRLCAMLTKLARLRR